MNFRHGWLAGVVQSVACTDCSVWERGITYLVRGFIMLRSASLIIFAFAIARVSCFSLPSKTFVGRGQELRVLKLRHAEEGDIKSIQNLAVDVFGITPDFGLNWFVNELLRRDLKKGFKAKIEAMKAASLRDHNVLVLVDDEDTSMPFYGLRGLIEVSLQPTTGETSSLMPLPVAIKDYLNKDRLYRPYISNLVVDPRYRRRGYARKLVAECEEISKAWGYGEVYLHVDMGEKPATSLYTKLGYATVSEEPAWKVAFSGVRLRFMRRALSRFPVLQWPWQRNQ